MEIHLRDDDLHFQHKPKSRGREKTCLWSSQSRALPMWLFSRVTRDPPKTRQWPLWNSSATCHGTHTVPHQFIHWALKDKGGGGRGGGEAITQAQGLSVQRKEQHIRRIHTTAAAVTQQEAAKWTVCPYIRQHSLDGRRDTTTTPPHPTPTHPLQAKDVADLAWS